MAHYFDFENELREIEDKIAELTKFQDEKKIDLSYEITKLNEELGKKLGDIYAKLSPWQKNLVARHPERPYTFDYIKYMCEDFIEFHGDRLFKDDTAIVGGAGTIDGKSYMIIGHQKGRDLQSNLYRNFGYANPDGYRKALRLMKMAERFNMPIITLIDTAGAYPGLEAEERGQGEAIARNLLEMAGLKVPVIAVIIGEGGSGGALGLGVANKVYMLENSIYSVISPEGCAAILFKDSSKAQEAAESLKIDADNLTKLKIVDGVISEPVGGAHRNHELAAANLKKKLLDTFAELGKMSEKELKDQRYEKFRAYGKVVE